MKYMGKAYLNKEVEKNGYGDKRQLQRYYKSQFVYE
jgi:hypothetical protein